MDDDFVPNGLIGLLWLTNIVFTELRYIP